MLRPTAPPRRNPLLSLRRRRRPGEELGPSPLVRVPADETPDVGYLPARPQQRRSVVVVVGNGGGSDLGAQALVKTLGEAGIEVLYLGREGSASRIAALATEARADAVEVCLAGEGGVLVLRDLLRELVRLDRREVTIVVHRVH